jgi:purine-nucleoside phosphorylase
MLQGRVHAYEGFPPETLTRGIELLAALGARTLLLTNASGGLRPDMQSGELLVMNDHLDFVAQPWGDAIECADGVAPTPGRWYAPRLVERALRAAWAAGGPARQGVYAYLLGPSYETRAEYRMLRTSGADAVGMSTVFEAIQARSLGQRVAAFSCLTNWAAGVSSEPLSHGEVMDTGRQAASALAGLLQAALHRGLPAA